MTAPERPLGLFTATAIVVANMIGTGIFTTTGFQAEDLGDSVTIVLAWILGGVLALAGALAYGELGASMPRAGAEYAYLRRVYSPWVGTLSGYVSLVAGFAAPLAAAAVALGAYLEKVVPALPARTTATAVIVLLTAAHLAGIHVGARVQNWASALKVLLLLGFVAAGFAVTATAAPVKAAAPIPGSFSGAFAATLVFVSFAYSGWNAAAYVGGEIRSPGRNLPWALVLGTGIVTTLYVLLNLVFFRAAAPHEMAGVREVGHLTATRLFGQGAGSLISLAIAALLVSSVSAMIFAGSRVVLAMAQDRELPRLLSRVSRSGAPRPALLLQSGLALVFVWATPFQDLLLYIGLTLSLFTGLAVLGVMVLRAREPDLERPFTTPGYPLVPVLYVGLSAWMIVFAIMERPTAALWSAATLIACLLLRLAVQRRGESAT